MSDGVDASRSRRYPPKRVTRGLIRTFQRSAQHLAVPHGLRRRFLDRAARLSPLPKGTSMTAETLGGVPAARLELGPADPDRAFLYLHGGSFCAGSLITHRALTSRLAREAGMPVHALDYRLAPEHPYPAALDDCEAAYAALLDSGLAPERIVVGGDSAGGWLALALAVRLRDRGGPLPAGLALICPFLDMTMSGETLETNSKRDIGLRSDWLRQTRPLFFTDPGLDPVELTPARGDLSGLPSIHLQTASDDVLRSDAELLRDRAQEQGAELEFLRWEDVWHDFQVLAGSLAEADEALGELARFAREATA
jgi:acetyl esterase/lipase